MEEIKPREFKRFKEHFNKKNIECMDFFIDELKIEVDGSKLLINDGLVPLPNLILIRNPLIPLDIIEKFESFGIICVNSSKGITNSRLKFNTANILANNGIPVPKTIPFTTDLEQIKEDLGFPFIIKPYPSALGFDIWLCRNKKDFIKFIFNMHKLENYQYWMIQKFIEYRYKEVVRAYVINHEVVYALVKRYPVEDTFLNHRVESHEPITITDEIRDLCSRTTKALGIEIGGIDLLYDEDSMKICEVNCSGYFLRSYDIWPDLDVAKLIVDYVSKKYLNK